MNNSFKNKVKQKPGRNIIRYTIEEEYYEINLHVFRFKS